MSKDHKYFLMGLMHTTLVGCQVPEKQKRDVLKFMLDSDIFDSERLERQVELSIFAYTGDLRDITLRLDPRSEDCVGALKGKIEREYFALAVKEYDNILEKVKNDLLTQYEEIVARWFKDTPAGTKESYIIAGWDDIGYLLRDLYILLETISVFENRLAIACVNIIKDYYEQYFAPDFKPDELMIHIRKTPNPIADLDIRTKNFYAQGISFGNTLVTADSVGYGSLVKKLSKKTGFTRLKEIMKRATVI